MTRSGLKSPGAMTMPPRVVRVPAPAPLRASTGISRGAGLPLNSDVRPTATGSVSDTRMASRLS